MKHRRILKPGDVIQSSIVRYDVLSRESRDGRVMLRSHVTGQLKILQIDCDYTLIKEG